MEPQIAGDAAQPAAAASRPAAPHRDHGFAPPLAALHGAVPPQPRWFADALAHEPECTWPVVHGARIETLAWGPRGAPGLLLLHGKMAHARWWSFIAPWFANTHRVVALSFSGMGGSDWRDAYSAATMADEAMAASTAAGLFDAPRRPLVVGHSFGGFVSLLCAQRHGQRLAGVLTLDMPLMSREQRQARTRPGLREAIALRPTKLYPSLATALARFRFAPEQPCENLYIADHIARTSLKPVSVDGGTAWTWRFDPKVAPVGPGNAALALREAACPLAMGWGADSALVT
ncbi:MAG TPA: alpha/beta hydrolase, partial [Burkholderiaceae bacterium]|nr:alpha/beta hydrolase [Burkholderiaceae bacterium]